MAPKSAKRRSPGEGSVWAYTERTAPSGGRSGIRASAPGAAARTARSGSPSAPLRTRCAPSWSTPPAASWSTRPASRPATTSTSGRPGCAWRRRPMASYRKNVRLHIKPRIGTVPLAALTTERINALYRELERSGRADHREGEGLSPRTVRYVHTILSAALGAAVKHAPAGPQPGRRRRRRRRAKQARRRRCTRGPPASWPRSWAGPASTADGFALWHDAGDDGCPPRRGPRAALARHRPGRRDASACAGRRA